PNRRPWKFDEVHKEVSVPNLDFSGWYDHCGGTMAHLKLMQENAQTAEARQQTKLVIGPWSHPTIGQRKIGEIDFGPQAQLDIHDLILRWFGYWLGGAQNGIDKEPPCRYFVMGSAKWKNAETWPPPMQEKTLYMGSDGQASAEGSGRLLDGIQETGSCDTYTFDPNDPVPTLWSRSLFSSPADRRKLEHRQDILYYRSEPLDQEVEVVGYPEVVLYASSSAPDTDFFARLIDEEPDGPATEVSYGFMRARHRNSYDTEELLNPGEVTEFRIKLSAAAIQFQAGHRIRIEITSSDFPNHDRNHNTGRNDLVDTELRKAEQTIHHSPEFPSRLIMPVDDS
ncbi:MAG: CocE/NonD family hydrolase, partial [Planctomycetota bacterium]|nr:CocE/NonD family hydrolase [Planctomycetota bacterium]